MLPGVAVSWEIPAVDGAPLNDNNTAHRTNLTNKVWSFDLKVRNGMFMFPG